MILLVWPFCALRAGNPYITPQMDQTVESILSKMTLEEKVKLCTGDIEGKAPRLRGSAAVDRLGVGAMVMYNGGRGFQAGTSTLFPAVTGQAAAFEPDLVRRMAGAMAAEARAGKTDLFEAPGINIIRDPLNGRNFEYFTEDPLLNAKLAAAFVRGAQDQGVVADAKHLICNDQELNRNEVDEVVGERALREIYLPGFQGAIDAGALSIMTGANKVNGLYTSSNADLLGIIKHDFGFQGCILTDWTGVRQTVEAANAGTDLSMPGTPTGGFSAPKLLAALKEGKVSESLVTDKARRVLRAAYFAGCIVGGPPKKPGQKPGPEHTAVALEAAQKAMVLLKNERKTLPLDPDAIRTVAVLGPHADKHFPGGGSSGVMHMDHEITAIAGIRQRLGENRVRYVPFDLDGLYQMLGDKFVKTSPAADAKPGFRAVYEGHKPGSADKAQVERQTGEIDFNWEMASPDRQELDPVGFTCAWTGFLTPPVDGEYTFRLAGTDEPSLTVDGKKVLTKLSAAAAAEGRLRLAGGKAVPIVVTYQKRGAQGSDARVRLQWMAPGADLARNQEMQAAVDAARQTDAAVVCIGQDHSIDSEGNFRADMELPGYQVELARAVAKVNPRTVVVLYTGSPVVMEPWINDVPALLLPWYPGSENGRALASVLLGDVNPAGKLPITWPKQEADAPSSQARQKPPKHDKVLHDEGVFVGYRWYDEQKIAPQFPFGFGLSYTTFGYGPTALSAPRWQPGGQGLEATVEVTNTGQKAGAEIVQFYVREKNPAVPRPPRELKAFAKPFLQPGEKQSVRVTLDDAAFAYWDETQRRWAIHPGDFEISACASSRDVRSSAVVAVTAGR